MKTSITTVCILLLSALSAIAQSSQMATLLHNGTITNFYSGTAFKDALEAAADGDVISLSSGIFSAADITKNVTIRGAGITVEGYNESQLPTVLSGNFKINCPESELYSPCIEGITHTGTLNIGAADNLAAYKCRFNKISAIIPASPNHSWKNLKFLHCIFSAIDDTSTRDSSIDFINCVIADEGRFTGSTSNGNTRQFTNCILYSYSSISGSNLTNSIVIMEKGSATGTQIEATCSVSHCIIAGCNKYDALNGNNRFISDKESIFSQSGFYELTPDMMDFKGNDGLQTGIHGGNMPFDPATSRPRITRFDVSSQTTSDGKLSVDIEVTNDN